MKFKRGFASVEILVVVLIIAVVGVVLIMPKGGSGNSLALNKDFQTNQSDSENTKKTDDKSSVFYIGSTPYVISVEYYGDNISESKLVLNGAYGEDTEPIYIKDEPISPCLSGVLPFSPIGVSFGFVSSYQCGDSTSSIITTASLTGDGQVELDSEINLNEYFSSLYLESIYQVLNWIDYKTLIISQKYFDGRGNINSEELYLFDINSLQKELIHTR